MIKFHLMEIYYICVFIMEPRALGHKLFSWSTFFLYSDFTEDNGAPSGFLSFNPELSLFGFLSTVIFFFNKISDLDKKGKSSNLC